MKFLFFVECAESVSIDINFFFIRWIFVVWHFSLLPFLGWRFDLRWSQINSNRWATMIEKQFVLFTTNKIVSFSLHYQRSHCFWFSRGQKMLNDMTCQMFESIFALSEEKWDQNWFKSKSICRNNFWHWRGFLPSMQTTFLRSHVNTNS